MADTFAGRASAAYATTASVKEAPQSRTSRCLSAAAYTDSTFRHRVLALSADALRAKAPELGIDIAAVVEHCRRAGRRQLTRDLLLCLPFLIFLGSGVVDYAINYRGYDLPADIIGQYGTILFACWLLAAGIVLFFAYLREQITLAQAFSARANDQSYVSKTGNAGNVIVYGAFSPFVGSGFDVGGYSFTVNLEQAKPDAEPGSQRPFSVQDVYNSLRRSFDRLAIDGLHVEENLFVDGRSIRDDPLFLPDPLSPPRSHVEPEYIDVFKGSPTKTVRYYLTVRIVDWSGEVVLSMFIRVAKTSSKMFVENSIFLLPPLQKKYYAVDDFSLSSPVNQFAALLVRSFFVAPFVTLVSPLLAFREISKMMGRSQSKRQQRHNARKTSMFNYGALQSVREIGMENNWRVYFQKLDNQMNSKVVQQQFIDALVRFLDEHGYDTADIKDRGNHIFNNGVMISGGTIQAESLAVGQGAQAKKKVAEKG